MSIWRLTKLPRLLSTKCQIIDGYYINKVPSMRANREYS